MSEVVVLVSSYVLQNVLVGRCDNERWTQVFGRYGRVCERGSLVGVRRFLAKEMMVGCAYAGGFSRMAATSVPVALRCTIGLGSCGQ